MSKPRPQPGLKYAAVLRRRNLKKGVVRFNEPHHPCNENKLRHPSCLPPNTAPGKPWNNGRAGFGQSLVMPPFKRRCSTKERGWRPLGAPSGFTRISPADVALETILLCSDTDVTQNRSKNGGRSQDLPPPLFHMFYVFINVVA